MAFKAGQEVLIPCNVYPGAFDTERLIIIEIQGKKISGFVGADYLVKRNGLDYVRAKIISTQKDKISAKTRASFFTAAAGVVITPPAWAIKNFVAQEARKL